MTTGAPPTTPPSPIAATDEAAFVAEVRRLKTWSGFSFRQLERRASAAGDTLPVSTAATMLGRNRLPRAELLTTFARACGLNEDDIRPWLATRAAIADGTGVVAVPPVPVPARPNPMSRRRMAIVAAVALAIAFVSGAALSAGTDINSTVEQEIVIYTP